MLLACSLAMVEALCDVSRNKKQRTSARRLLFPALFTTLLLLLCFVGGVLLYVNIYEMNAQLIYSLKSVSYDEYTIWARQRERPFCDHRARPLYAYYTRGIIDTFAALLVVDGWTRGRTTLWPTINLKNLI